MLARFSRRLLSLDANSKAALMVSMSLSVGDGARSQTELVNALKKARLIPDERVAAVMASVDRARFVSPQTRFPYADTPQIIAPGVAVTSANMHAVALSALLRQRDLRGNRLKALDAGCGSGYVAACLGQLVGSSGRVVAVDRHPECIKWARRAISEALGENHNVTVSLTDDVMNVSGDFDYIHVGFAFPREQAKRLAQSKLSPGGVMVVPVTPPDEGGQEEAGGAVQRLVTITKPTTEGEPLEWDSILERVAYSSMEIGIASIEDHRATLQSLDVELEHLKAQIKDWHAEFKTRNCRTPSAADMQSEAGIAKLLARFRTATAEKAKTENKLKS